MHLARRSEVNFLLVGNSQLACIKKVHDSNKNILGQHGSASFYVTPGGPGPHFTVKNDLLVVNKKGINPNFPPRAYPENTPSIPLGHYDAIVVSALGYVDGGFCYPNPITRQGLLVEYGPKENGITQRPLSKICYRQVIESTLVNQPGFLFLSDLRRNFAGTIIVQPFPLLANGIKDHPGWPLNQMYMDPLGAHRFFSEVRDEVLARICNSLKVELLPYPNSKWRNNLFTPSEYMVASDGLHPSEEYAKLVLEQISKVLASYTHKRAADRVDS